MQSKWMWALIGVAVVLVVGFAVWGALSPSGSGSSLDRIVSGTESTYYFGAECPHCADVKKFFEEKGVRDKVLFSEKEVWHNKKNAAEMKERAKTCGLDENAIGVPFLYLHGKCFVGTPEAIKAFEEEMKKN